MHDVPNDDDDDEEEEDDGDDDDNKNVILLCSLLQQRTLSLGWSQSKNWFSGRVSTAIKVHLLALRIACI